MSKYLVRFHPVLAAFAGLALLSITAHPASAQSISVSGGTVTYSVSSNTQQCGVGGSTATLTDYTFTVGSFTASGGAVTTFNAYGGDYYLQNGSCADGVPSGASPASVSLLGSGFVLVFYPGPGSASAQITSGSPSIYLSSSSGTATYGTAVTLTVSGTLVSGTYLDRNTVTFYNGGTVLGTATPDIYGNANLTTSSLPVGSYSISASIAAGGNFGAATSNAITQTVTQAMPTISIGNIPASASYGGTLAVAYSYSGTGSPTLSVSSSTTGVCAASGNTVSYVGIGTCTLTASATATTNYKAVMGSAQSFAVNQAVPNLSISDIPSGAVYGGNFTVAYSYTGNGALSVWSTTTSVCTTSGNTVNFVGVGTCTLTAGAAGTTYYTAVTGNAQSFTVAAATPAISINNIPSGAKYGGSFTATDSYSGNGSPAESISSSTTSVCTVSGNTVNYVGVGTCTLTASATATTDYTAVTGSAQSFSVGAATPTISISNIPGGATYNGSFAVTYSYSGNGSPTKSVSSSTTGVCTVSGSTVSYVGVGTCTLTASATATADYTAITGSAQSFTVSAATPAISISDIPSNATYGGNFTVAYTYSGNGSPTKSVSSSTTGVCTASGSVVSYVGAGTCTLTASATATTDYTAVTGTAQSFTVSSATPTISINNIPSGASYGGSFTATYSYSGTGSPTESVSSSTAGVCTISGNAVSFVGVGTCTLQASAGATSNYTAVTGSLQSFTVGAATPTISISDIPASAIYGGSLTVTYSYSGNGAPAESVSSSTAGVCTVSGNRVNYVGTGTCTLAASATATTDYIAVTGSAQSVTVNAATPTISINDIPAGATKGGGFTVSYSYSGNGSPTESVASSTTSVCTVAGALIRFVGVGTCTLTASATATADFTAVKGTAQSFVVNASQIVFPSVGDISTIVGNGTVGYSGDGGFALGAELYFATAIAVDNEGNIYIADFGSNRIRKVTASTGQITTVAGNGTAGYAGDSGAATSAELNYPTAVAVDSSGNIYIADYGNSRIRKVTASNGFISTVAGNGTSGYSGDGGAATLAELYFPTGVAVDSAGNLYIADYANNRIRKVSISTGYISSVAGNGIQGYSGDSGLAVNAELNGPVGVVVDGAGNIYIADQGNNRIRKVTASTGNMSTVAGNGAQGYFGDGEPAANAELDGPTGVALDSAGNIYIADQSNNRIRKVAIATGYISTAAGNGTAGFSGDGGAATSAELYDPSGVAVDLSGNLYLADEANSRIRVVGSGGSNSSVSVSCAPSTAAYGATINCTATVAGTNPTGTINWVAPVGVLGNATLSNGSASVSGGSTWTPGSYAITAIYSGDGMNDSSIGSASITINPAVPIISINDIPVGAAKTNSFIVTYAYSGNGSPTESVTSSTPSVCTVSGNLVAYLGTGTCTLTASATATPDFAAVTGAAQSFTVTGLQTAWPAPGNINTIVGNGTVGYSGDGGPALNAEFNAIGTTAVDRQGNIYIPDWANYRVREVNAATGIISTVAGNGASGYSGDGGPATSAKLSQPWGIGVDWNGNIYFTDGPRIRKVNASNGTITTVAGNGTQGYSGDGGSATTAEIAPAGVAVDSAGNIYIADSGNNRIRKVNAATGAISTFAGTGVFGFSGDDGPATSAQLTSPQAVAVDSAGNVYIADTGNGAVREVSASTGNIWTVWQNATNRGGGIVPLGEPVGVAVDGANNLYVADVENGLIYEGVASTFIATASGGGYFWFMPIVAGNGTQGYSGDGGPAIDAEINPLGIASDIQGNIYIGGSNRIRVVATSMTGPQVAIYCNPSAVSYYGSNIQCTAFVTGNNPTGTVTWTVNGNQWATTPLNGGGTSISGGATWPQGLYFITASYSGDDANSVSSNSATITVGPAMPTISIRNIPFSATYGGSFAVTYSYSGSESPTVSISSSTPGVCAVSGSTVSFVGTGTCTLTASASATPNYAAVTGVPQSFTVATPAFVLPAQGNISTIAGTGTAGYSGDGGAATSAKINAPRGSFIDSWGNVYIADYSNNLIRKITASTGLISTIAGNGTAGYSGDGGQATSAKLNVPSAVAVDSAGNIYIADNANNRIREVTPSGVISTIAGNGTAGYTGDGGAAINAELSAPSGVAVDAAGNIYIADSNNNRIREVYASSGVISTVAGNGTAGYSGDGGAATSAKLNAPTRLALDVAGNIYIVDTNNNRIREVAVSSGVISTVAGNGSAGYSGDGAAATSAMINGPRGLAVDVAGNIYIADANNNRIREVTVSNGFISTIAGNGTAGYTGDGGVATSAELNSPYGVALDSARNIYITDTSNQRIRVVGGIGPASPPPSAVGYDTGTVNLYVCSTYPCVTSGSGSNVLFTQATSYGQASTPQSVAAALAGTNSSVNVAALNNTLYILATGTGATSNYGYLLTSASNYPGNVFSASFQGLPASGSLGGGAGVSSTQQTIYSYSLVYDPAGNVQSVNDSVMGSWTYGYDSLNRLITGQDTATTPTSQQFAGQNLCWAYDSFGNRTVQSQQSAACPAQSASTWVFNANNQVGAVISPTGGAVSPSPYTYDAAGDVTMDQTKGNQYLYDAEGRICASASQAVDGTTVLTGYVYNPEGIRVAKGTITNWTCDPSSNGLTTAKNETDYILGPSGEQVTEVAQNANGTMNWQRTYVNAASGLIATYESVPNPQYIPAQYNPANPTVDPPTIAMPSFRLTDWLGTMRATTDASGVLQGTCTGLPYGDGVACSGDIPDPHHFTGKERDTETGNDYFGARYYAGSMGRWLSPDWSAKVMPVPYAGLDDPQTLDLYAYVGNNPIGRVDTNGHFYWVSKCDEKHDAGCHASRQKFRDTLKNLKRADKSYKKGSSERKALDRALKTIGKENKGGPGIAFGDLSAQHTNATTSPDGNTLTFDLDSPGMKNSAAAVGAVAEEATHSADDHDPRRGNLSPFSLEYRGHQANAWAVEGVLQQSGGLQKVTSAGTVVTVWDPRTGHRETGDEIKSQILDDYNDEAGTYNETNPHDPWGW